MRILQTAPEEWHMFSIVLATALVAAPATPNWHRCGGCGGYTHGCYNGYSGYGGYGGYSGYAGYGGYAGCAGYGCFGYGHGPQVLHYGGAGPGYGYHGGCYGAGYGAVHPDLIQGYPGCTGCYGCYGGYAGYGIPVPIVVDPRPQVPPVDPFPPINPDVKKKDAEEIPSPKEIKKKDEKKPEEKKPEPKKDELSRARVRIEIPQGGKLFVDGRHIDVAAGTRIFQTPALAIGERYFYDFKIEVMIDGVARSDERRVVIERGQDVAVEFANFGQPATTARRER
jgi:uncharacterized protein (TIGR03000 family)